MRKTKLELNTIEDINKSISICYQQRINLNLTQQELANKIGIKQSALARIENLKVMPRIDTLIKLIKGLNLEIKIDNQNNCFASAILLYGKNHYTTDIESYITSIAL